MTAQTYYKISEPIRRAKHGAAILSLLNSILTYCTYIAYPLLLVYLIIMRDARVIKAFLVPALTFICFSIVRQMINAPRPYEVLEIVPLIEKSTKGKSFPSRHVFSIFVIAVTFFDVSLPLGIVFSVFGVMLAIIRVIGGVHFPRDVIVGAIIGILCGVQEFII